MDEGLNPNNRNGYVRSKVFQPDKNVQVRFGPPKDMMTMSLFCFIGRKIGFGGYMK